MALSKTFEKSFRTWMDAQTPEVQAEAAEMLNRAKSGAITPKELSKYQEKYTPKTSGDTPTKKKPAAKTEAPKAEAKPAPAKTGAAKVKSVANNPAAKATADAVKAEAAAAGTAAKPVVEKAKTAGQKLSKGLGKYVAPAYVGANVVGRGMEMYKDLGEGKTLGEALDKPESNKQVAEAAVDTGLALAGMRLGSRFGLPGAVIGGIGLPLAGKLGLRVADVAVRGPRKPAGETSKETTTAVPAKPQRQFAYEEIESMAKQKGVPFEDAFRQIQQMQNEEINKRAPVEEVRRDEPAGEIFTPSDADSASLAQEAVRAPIGQEPDIMSFLEQPDTQQMLAELSAKQASRVQSAGNDAASNQKKKRETSSLGMREEKTTNPANDRPMPRFYVNTGRFGTTRGAGSRRPLG